MIFGILVIIYLTQKVELFAIKKYVFSESSMNYLLKNVKHISQKKFQTLKNILQKSHIFISPELQLIIVFSNLRFFYEPKQKAPVSKTCIGFSIFDPVYFI